MSQAPVGLASGLVRVTVASGSRRVDLVLPGAVPVAELVPELARSVGLLDPATVYGGYRLVTAEGRELAGDAGLVVQGVEDGGLLSVAAGVDDDPPRVYDDVVEAMTDVVEHDLRPWEPAAGRRTALCAAGLLMLLGAVALLVQRGSLLAGVAAVVVAAALVTGAIVLSRAQREPEAAVAVAWMGALYAAVAGLSLADPGTFGDAAVATGGAAATAGLVCLIGLGAGRPLVLPPVIAGTLFLLTGLLLESVDVHPANVLTISLVAVVVLGSLAPWMALGATTTSVDQLYELADITAEPRPVDPERVAADARVAHEILVAVTATVGVLVVLIAPFAVSLGVVGSVVAVMSCLAVMLRTRQYRTGTEVLVGLASGILGLLATAAAALWLHPDWRPTVAVLLAGAGAVLLAVTLLPRTPSVRRGRFGDVAEGIALLSLLPLLLVAVGVFSSIRG